MKFVSKCRIAYEVFQINAAASFVKASVFLFLDSLLDKKSYHTLAAWGFLVTCLIPQFLN